ncbi:MAG: TorF family putative porin [Sulfurisoma sp.]|nr:TorF family putative porin [Sulfurisoma sp.]
MNLKLSLLAAALPLAFAASSFAAEEAKKDAAPAPDWTWTGHVDLNSKYYLRGVTNTYGPQKYDKNNRNTVNQTSNGWGDAPESDKPALSWGVDFTHSSGWYVGYWASQLTYSYERVGESYDLYKTGGAPAVPGYGYYDKNNSIENDLYGGYTGKIGDLGYNIGLTYYVYAPGKHSNAPETKIALTYGEFGLSAQTLLEDTIWGNKMDTYWTATWTKALPYDLTLTANLGYYTYGKEGKYLGSKDAFTGTTCAAGTYFFVNGCYAPLNPDGTAYTDGKLIDGGFRHLTVGVSQPIGSTGLTWNIQAIHTGINRFNQKQDNKITAGIAYAF